MRRKADTGWVDHALERLAEAGYRRGGARSRVVELLGRQSCGLSAREIDARLDAEGQAIGRASVYRTLEALAELKLVQRLDLGNGTARYEPHHPSGEHHHHLVCDSCGQVTPFEDPELESALEHLAGRVDYHVDEHDLVLHGSS
ncbi:MAG: Fur family transcriptional regulator, ferric uptake regulator, partial [Thermoleophilaceae bacterium]|nr:Fur family transcriptional regulator, ferric uptake regulator [Thermoleophilaceae bacterium]